MVAFVMSEEDSAAIVRDVAQRNPPPSSELPRTFSNFVCLLGLYDSAEEVERFGRMCGLNVLAHVEKIEKEEPDSAAA